MKLNIKLFILCFSLNLSAQDVIYVQPIIATKAFQGTFGTATLQIRDANEDGQITKPLIVAEGLDTGLLAQAGSIGDNDYRNFRASVLESLSLT